MYSGAPAPSEATTVKPTLSRPRVVEIAARGKPSGQAVGVAVPHA